MSIRQMLSELVCGVTNSLLLSGLDSQQIYGSVQTISMLLKNYESLQELNTVDSQMVLLDLDRAIDRSLNPFQKQVVFWYFWMGYTQEEVAQILGVYTTKICIEGLRILERLKSVLTIER